MVQTSLWHPMKADNLLFHYTDIGAAIGILQSGVLYFSHHQKMNDTTEFFHADVLLHSASEQAFNEIFKEEKTFSVALKGRDYEQALKHDSKEQIKALSKTLSNDYYIFSSTQHADKYEMQNGSLVMWRGYGKESGCTIVFDKEKLVALADTLPQKAAAIATIKGEICYLEKAEEVETKFSDEYRVFVNYLKHMTSMAFNPTGESLYDNVDGLNPYIKMKALTKHHAFRSENEYRLSILRSIPTITGANSNLIPVENGTIKLPIADNGIPIKKIIISPFSNQEENYNSMRKFIESRPQYMNIQITKSVIPHT